MRSAFYALINFINTSKVDDVYSNAAKMILENMVFPKNTDLTLLFRWVCLWMRIAFHLHSLFLMAIKTSSLLCLLWSKRLLKTSKPLTLSYVRMPVFLRLPTENSTVSKAEDLLQHSLLKS